MKKTTVIALVLSSVIFPSIFSLRADEAHNHSNSQDGTMKMKHGSGEHSHGTLMISEGQPVPDVDLIVSEDPVNGWNLELKLENFTFTPENVNQPNQPNEGHAHLYVNGEQVSRIYSNWYHLPNLPQGSNEIKVGLNANGHEMLMYDGAMIEDVEVVEVP